MNNEKEVDFMCHQNQETFHKAQRLFGEDETTRKKLVQELREWIESQEHFVAFTDEHNLTMVIRGCKYDLDKAKKKTEAFLTIKSSSPLFKGWDPLLPEIQAALSAGGVLPLAGYDDEYRKVFVIQAANYDPTELKKSDLEKASLMKTTLSLYQHEEYCMFKLVSIVDLNNFSLSHMTREFISTTLTCSKMFQEGSALQPKLVIILGTSPVIGYCLRLFTVFFKEKLRKRFRVIGNDFEQLHQLVPRRMLPVDYGGDGPSLKHLSEYWKEKCQSNRQYLMEVEKLGVDESKRPRPDRSSWW